MLGRHAGGTSRGGPSPLWRALEGSRSVHPHCAGSRLLPSTFWGTKLSRSAATPGRGGSGSPRSEHNRFVAVGSRGTDEARRTRVAARSRACISPRGACRSLASPLRVDTSNDTQHRVPPRCVAGDPRRSRRTARRSRRSLVFSSARRGGARRWRRRDRAGRRSSSLTPERAPLLRSCVQRCLPRSHHRLPGR